MEKKARNRNGRRQISFEVAEEFHESLKKHVSEQDETIKDWIMKAMTTQFIADQHFGWQ